MQSYALLTAATSTHDYDERAKPLARRMLETTSLPSGAAIWGQKGGWFSLLKRSLDLTYSCLDVGYRWSKTSKLLEAPMTALAFGYYAMRPSAAELRTAALMAEPDVQFVKRVWTLMDSRTSHA